jgi:hypothetical protein
LSEKRSIRRYLLIVIPHDVDFGCSGTIAKWHRLGVDITYVVCTSGDKAMELVAEPDAVAAIRKKEGVCLCRSLPASGGHVNDARPNIQAVENAGPGLQASPAPTQPSGSVQRPDSLSGWASQRAARIHLCQPGHRDAGVSLAKTEAESETQRGKNNEIKSTTILFS